MLNSALEAHRAGQEAEAIELYLKVCRTKTNQSIAYQNVLPLLRKKKCYAEAEEIFALAVSQGLANEYIYNNFANILRDKEEFLRSIIYIRKALCIAPHYIDASITLIANLRQLGLDHLALRYGIKQISSSNDNLRARIALPVLELLLEQSNDAFKEILDDLLLRMPKVLSEVSDYGERFGLCAGLSIALIKKKDYKHHEIWDMEARQLIEQMQLEIGYDRCAERLHSYFWNISIFALNAGLLSKGWDLFDHGLRVAAPLPQRWQRSFPKYASAAQLTVYTQNQGNNSTILVLHEQGIGDTMMFATLLVEFSNLAERILFVPGDRLESIYRRTFEDSASIEVISESMLKYHLSTILSRATHQMPIGSIPRHLNLSINEHHIKSRKQRLIAESKLTSSLISKYRRIGKERKIVGISWSGGGIKKRILQKSISLDNLLPIFRIEGVTFISLQYGDASSMLQSFNKKFDTNIIYDESINALADMDSWLSQVNACDAIISIANTTIHGAGGLHKPTACLLSRTYDWRWTHEDVYPNSYWYPTVKVFREDSTLGWDPAIEGVVEWMKNLLETG